MNRRNTITAYAAIGGLLAAGAAHAAATWDVADPMTWTDIIAWSVIVIAWGLFALCIVWPTHRKS